MSRRETGDIALDSNPHNQPHVDCPFTVTFFGFDVGDVAKVTFTAWAPTGKGTLLPTDTVDIGADDNSGGGSPAGFDGAKTYKLDFDGIVPHEQQGFHVKLTVSVTSPGSKTPKFNKFKVFWAQPCEEETSSSSSTTSSTSGGGTGSGVGGGTGGGVGDDAGGGVGDDAASSLSSGADVLASTGSNPLPLLVAAMVLLGLGAITVLVSRRRHRGAR